MLEMSFPYICLLVGTGFLAGIINTMAGGGSNLTIPALMMLGLPADIANANIPRVIINININHYRLRTTHLNRPLNAHAKCTEI